MAKKSYRFQCIYRAPAHIVTEKTLFIKASSQYELKEEARKRGRKECGLMYEPYLFRLENGPTVWAKNSGWSQPILRDLFGKKSG